jgi:hypothetical protein
MIDQATMRYGSLAISIHRRVDVALEESHTDDPYLVTCFNLITCELVMATTLQQVPNDDVGWERLVERLTHYPQVPDCKG